MSDGTGRARRLLTLPMLGAHLLAVVLVAIAAGLGLWQLDAWQERRAAEAVDLTRLDPVPMTSVMGPDAPFMSADVGRPVSASGRWLPQGTILVSGREDEGREGYWVVTPLDLGDASVLVVRGWTKTPEPPPVGGRATVVGWLQPSEGQVGLTDPDPTDDVLPQLRVADAVQRIDTDLWDGYVVLDPERSGQRAQQAQLEPADLAALPAAGRFTALRNLLYAFEWWVFGLFAGYVWWRHVADELAEPDPAGTDGQPGAG